MVVVVDGGGSVGVTWIWLPRLGVMRAGGDGNSMTSGGGDTLDVGTEVGVVLDVLSVVVVVEAEFPGAEVVGVVGFGGVASTTAGQVSMTPTANEPAATRPNNERMSEQVSRWAFPSHARGLVSAGERA